jgi:hypothetical protein
MLAAQIARAQILISAVGRQVKGCQDLEVLAQQKDRHSSG